MHNKRQKEKIVSLRATHHTDTRRPHRFTTNFVPNHSDLYYFFKALRSKWERAEPEKKIFFFVAHSVCMFRLSSSSMSWSASFLRSWLLTEKQNNRKENNFGCVPQTTFAKHTSTEFNHTNPRQKNKKKTRKVLPFSLQTPIAAKWSKKISTNVRVQ